MPTIEIVLRDDEGHIMDTRLIKPYPLYQLPINFTTLVRIR